MRKSRFTEEQIAYALKQVEAGVPQDELCRKYGISQATLYRWKSKFGGLAASELKRLKELETAYHVRLECFADPVLVPDDFIILDADTGEEMTDEFTAGSSDMA